MLFAISSLFGNVEPSAAYAGQYFQNQELPNYRYTIMNIGSIISFGPILYDAGSNQLAAIASIGVLICCYYLIKEKVVFKLLFYSSLIVTGILFIILMQSRAIFIAVIFSIILFLFLNRKFIVLLFLLLMFSTIVFIQNYDIFGLLYKYNLFKLAELQAPLAEIGNYSFRLNFMIIALNDISIDPLGLGFNHYYNLFIDDSILYANLLNGSGIVGFIIFILMMIYLFIKFIKGALYFNMEIENRALCNLGIALIVLMLISGFSTRYLFDLRIYSALFWSIIGTIFSISDRWQEI